MSTSLMAFLFSTGAVILAEMGDKTQLLAMAFATKYKAKKVMTGVFIATVLNHGIAVGVGHYVTQFQSIEVWIQSIASISFVVFGLWTIRGDKIEEDDTNNRYYLGPVAAVSIAFFIAELGDKTQLATIALAARFSETPIFILIGTTTGMMIADAIGIIFGVVMCKRIHDHLIKLISAGAFMIFGYIGCFQVMVHRFNWGIKLSVGVVTAIMIGSCFIAYKLTKNNNQNKNRIHIENVKCQKKIEADRNIS